MDVAQTVTSRFNVDGRAQPVVLVRQVPACGAVVLGIHEHIAGDVNFGVSVSSPYPTSATLIMRSFVTPESLFDPAKALVPPVDRVR